MEINSPIAKKWLKFSANNVHQKFWDEQWKDYYEKKKREYNGHMSDLIEKDVARSCYTLEDFPRFQNMIRKQMSDMLHAYCAYDPELGYTQGMSFIVERLLAHLTDYQAFIVWIGILKTDDFRSYYTDDFGDRLQKHFQEIITLDICLKFPEMDKQIRKLTKKNDSTMGCSESQHNAMFVFYALYTQIAMTLGCILPISTKVKDTIITEFLQDRNKTYTTCTVLFGVLYVLEKDIMTCRGMEDMFQLLSMESLKTVLRDQDILSQGKMVRDQYPLTIHITLESPQRRTPVKMDSSDDSEFWFIGN